MKKFSVKAISLLLSVLLIIPCGIIFASADEGTPFTYVTGANAASSSYKNSKFYENLHKLTITGDQRTDLVAVAITQAGYFESNSNGDFGGTNAGTKNFCEYNYNMGDFGIGYGDSGNDKYHWCAAFVSWAILQSRVYSLRRGSLADWCRNHDGSGDTLDTSYMWREASCSAWTNQLNRAGYFKKSKYRGGSYTPLTGDLIFFTYNNTSAGHIGIVIYSDGTYVYTVDGNTNDQNGLETNGNCVAVKKYTLGSDYIFGYGAMPYVEKPEAKIDFSGANKTTGLYMNTDANKYIYSDEACTETIGIISRFTIFETIKVCDNGNLKVVSKLSDGSTATGYIDPSASRVYQLTSTSAPLNAIDLENNVAAGKSYTTSLLYRQGGADVDWAYDATQPINYDDEGGISLTDEIIAMNVSYEDTSWAGLHYGTPDAAEKGYVWVNVDLEAAYDITECRLYVPATDLGGGVNTPAYVSFWGSLDGVNYTQIGQGTVTAVNDATASMTLQCDTTARYIEARIVHGGWAFVSEIAVVGTPWDGTTEPDTSDPDTSDPDTSVPDTSDPDTSEPDTSEPDTSEPDISEPEPEIPEYTIDFSVNGNAALNIYDINGDLLSETSGDEDTANVDVTVTDDISFTLTPADGWALLGVFVDGESYELSDMNMIDCETASVIEIFLAPIPEAPDVESIKMSFKVNSDGETYSGEIAPIVNALYSFDGVNFTENNTKSDCLPLTEYTLYVKIVDMDNNLESEVVSVKFTSPELPYMLGDINENQKIDMTDYILLKRNYFGTYDFDADAVKRGDINQNQKIDMTDYILLKRVYFGTYTIK